MLNKRAFTLIEIVVVIAIIAVVATIMVPMFRRHPDAERRTAIAKLNTVVQEAWQHSMASGAVMKVEFDIQRERITLAQLTGKTGLEGEDQATPFTVPGGETEARWPNVYRVEQFFIDGRLQSGKEQIWFYITPGGITQRVIINAVDEDASEGAAEPVRFSLVLNPFYAQFKEFPTYQSP